VRFINKKFLFLLLWLLFQKSLFSQSIEIGEWLGEWESAFRLNGDSIEEHLSIKEVHKRNFIQFTINGGIVADTTLEFKYSTDMFLTLDFDKHNFAGFLIDDRGFKGMMKLDGEMSGQDQLTLIGKNDFQSIKTVWQLKSDGKLYRDNIIKLTESNKEISTGAVFIKRN